MCGCALLGIKAGSVERVPRIVVIGRRILPKGLTVPGTQGNIGFSSSICHISALKLLILRIFHLLRSEIRGVAAVDAHGACVWIFPVAFHGPLEFRVRCLCTRHPLLNLRIILKVHVIQV